MFSALRRMSTVSRKARSRKKVNLKLKRSWPFYAVFDFLGNALCSVVTLIMFEQKKKKKKNIYIHINLHIIFFLSLEDKSLKEMSKKYPKLQKSVKYEFFSRVNKSKKSGRLKLS